MIGLTNDECCLIHNLHVEQGWGSERIMKVFSNKWAHLSWTINSRCWNCSNSISVWWFAVYVALYWRSWKEPTRYTADVLLLERTGFTWCVWTAAWRASSVRRPLKRSLTLMLVLRQSFCSHSKLAALASTWLQHAAYFSWILWGLKIFIVSRNPTDPSFYPPTLKNFMDYIGAEIFRAIFPSLTGCFLIMHHLSTIITKHVKVKWK